MPDGGLRRLKRLREPPSQAEPESKVPCQLKSPASAAPSIAETESEVLCERKSLAHAAPRAVERTEELPTLIPKRRAKVIEQAPVAPDKGKCAQAPELDLQLSQVRLGNLRELSLQGSFLGLAGAMELAMAMSAKTCKLTSLALGDNRCGAQGAGILAEALMNDRTITYFSLSDNQIGDEGAERMAACLEKNKVLLQLELPLNGIRNNGAEKLAMTLKKNTTLRSMSLFGNRIGQAGMLCFAKLLKKSSVLTSLDLWDNSGWDEDSKDCIAIRKALKKNRTLHKQITKADRRAASSQPPLTVSRIASDSSIFCAVMEATSPLLEYLDLPMLFRVSCCARAVRADVIEGTWRLQRLCETLDYEDFELSFGSEAADETSSTGSSGTRRLVARRSCTKMRTRERFLGMLRLAIIQPHVKHLLLASAPTDFVRCESFWKEVLLLKALEGFTYPLLGWPDSTTRNRFDRKVEQHLNLMRSQTAADT